MPPSICPEAVSGLTITPESTAITSLSTVTCAGLRIDSDFGKLRRERRRRYRRNIGRHAHDLFLVIAGAANPGDLGQGNGSSIRRDGLPVRSIGYRRMIRFRSPSIIAAADFDPLRHDLRPP